ncbi:hypothetical protein [Comamonas thiooxydans]|uniref:hypothetical protein n=1 Tax=Comamonas thiooxydans TaxID=363952 RepID=UPI0005105723|nr:hypothetical protein [Comamonas thiooxydans]KGH22345.1 hypothetical protein P606_16195 [Comamonas thiooxydans]
MAEYKKKVDFANFVCHFGDQELLDFLNEIVLPAFEGNYIRKYGEETMFLHQVEVININPPNEKPEMVISGRFVVDTILKRTQVYQSGIIPDSASMEVALSAFFVLRLRDHKLIYVKEVSGAPGLAKFRTTIESFLKRRRVEYINIVYTQLLEKFEKGEITKRVTKKSILKSIGAPVLEILELPGKGSLSAFIQQFQTLNEVQVRMIKPNNEIDNSGLFRDLRTINKNLESEVTTISYRNPEGLKKDNVEDQLEGALDGNSELILRGKREDGSKIHGSNKDFSLSLPIEKIPAVIKEAASYLNKLFNQYIKYGTLSVAKMDGVVA